MKKLNRLLCLLLAFALLFSVCCVSVSAAEKPALNKKSITITVGSSTTLKVTGTESAVTWSTSDKSVCTVSKSGKVTAKSEGTANVYAKVGSTKLTCKVKVLRSYIKSASDQTLEKGESILLYIKSYSVKKAKAVSSDAKIAKVSAPTISDGYIVVKISGVSAGTADIKLYDANNKKASVTFKVTVKKKGSSSGSKKSTDSSNYAEEVLELVNKERVKNGVAKVTLDETLCKAARIRAKEIAENYGIFRPDGSLCFTVLEEVGLPFAAAFEQIAQGYDNCEDVVEYWNKNKNLLADYDKIGVGYDEESESWVIIFRD